MNRNPDFVLINCRIVHACLLNKKAHSHYLFSLKDQRQSLLQKIISTRFFIKRSIHKTIAIDPFLFSSSQVMSGTGFMLVVSVGKNSYKNKLQSKIKVINQNTSQLQKKLSALSQKIGTIGLVATIFIFVALIAHFIYNCFQNESFAESFVQVKTLVSTNTFLITSFSILIFTVPQVSLVVSLEFAWAVKNMINESFLVRRIQACQNLGQATTICTDKTGNRVIDKLNSFYKQ